MTAANAEGDVGFVVTSNGVEFPAVSFSYASASSPTVDSSTPDSSTGVQSLTIAGSSSGTAATVSVGGAGCVVTSSAEGSVSCDLPAVAGVDYSVGAYNPDLGLSNNIVFLLI